VDFAHAVSLPPKFNVAGRKVVVHFIDTCLLYRQTAQKEWPRDWVIGT